MAVVKDPVCGMVFVKEDAAGQTLYKSKTYYFVNFHSATSPSVNLY